MCGSFVVRHGLYRFSSIRCTKHPIISHHFRSGECFAMLHVDSQIIYVRNMILIRISFRRWDNSLRKVTCHGLTTEFRSSAVIRTLSLRHNFHQILLQTFSTSSLDGGEWSNSRSGTFTRIAGLQLPLERGRGESQCRCGCKEKNLSSYPESNPIRQVCNQPIY